MEVPIRILQDAQHRHTMVIPKNVWNFLGLKEGDWLLVDFKRAEEGEVKVEPCQP